MQHITLKRARENAELSQQQLVDRCAAKGATVSKATISRIENGAITNPLHDTVRALEQALDLEPGQLVFRELTIAEERRAIDDRRAQERRQLLRRRANRDEEGERRASDRRGQVRA